MAKIEKKIFTLSLSPLQSEFGPSPNHTRDHARPNIRPDVDSSSLTLLWYT